jgi:MFS family permease
MVLVSGIGLVFGYIPTLSFTFGVFMPSLIEAFGWTRGQVSTGFSMSLITMVVAMPLIGRLVDRVGAKRVILPSALVFGLFVASLSMLTEHIWHFYGIFIVMGLVGVGTAPLAYSSVIAHWFDRKRGIALGVTMVGLGLGSSVMPSVAHVLIDTVGWRQGYLLLGAAVITVTIPVVGLFLRERPEMLGLRPDGEPEGEPRPHAGNVEGMSIREVSRTGTFWLMCIVFFLIGMTVIGCLIHLVPMLTDYGVSARTAALATSTVGVSLVFGRVVAGYLLDHFFAVRVAVVFFLGVGLSILLFWSGISNWLVFLAALMLGMGLGAESDIIPFLVSRYFGLKSFTEIYGYTNASFTLGGVVGPLFMGVGFDQFGSYRFVLAGFGAATLVSLALITQLSPYRYGAPRALSKQPNNPEKPFLIPFTENNRYE